MSQIAILLAAYNGEKYIQEQLDSIIHQNGITFDLFISLDKSTDNTLSIIHKYQEEHNNIHLLSYGERYGSAGQNFFRLLKEVDFSPYDFVAFSDQDDLWHKDKIKSAIEMLEIENKDAYSSNITAFWEDGKRKKIIKDQPQVEFDYLFESAGPGCTFVFNSTLAKDIQKTLIQKQNDIHQLWIHDWFCYSFARSRGYQWIIDNNSYLDYRQHDNNVIGANSGFAPILRRIKTVLKGDALDKVMTQAIFLEQENLKPIKLIKTTKPSNYLKLASIAKLCRRSSKEKLIFSCAITLISIQKLLRLD